ncbi:16S rRNA pseudouridine(516) synthase RsuA [Shewanella fidelis]|uniref:Pseudouridine synthase n=1 Tax=Shewanella fidelis TaxID=173509 RepID=A0AAW8NJD5_9GAMM|nr:16S rRNA pseudouridine(516) synthase RsuA [Shewanella fidelis]MDR8522781.1 16S rRNA pseudouridine(516) synthase RsuA [Shewanella fidelis]MDW4812396.1 16S rRNA pseudouridine(516) synthase RsuA [Shewanella fidelis]MDW4815939.1 16S rRNA pseudouridine(516) synthase RsuA [Shewanella fidelis]MDW4820637.1 16S rRNA pseudouridine(516) synthase RsuA [Shewanella fidelis]MDW4824859.1 16S rRNA pseudouridine(516) synthase RsuA [Shewanella fidelis]
MRLDKFICESTSHTRVSAKKALHRGDVTCNGEVIKNSGFKVTDEHEIRLEGELLSIIGPRFIMLNKPVDTICSTIDEEYQSVISLLDVIRPEDLHIAGRLDADTTGLVLITTDGQWSHKITSPKRECAKRYLLETADPLTEDLIQQFADGVQLNNEDGLTKPALLEILGANQARLTITEGKYHQVKRMLAAVGNKVTKLHRESIGAIELDSELGLGEWRYLTESEIKSVK